MSTLQRAARITDFISHAPSGGGAGGGAPGGGGGGGASGGGVAENRLSPGTAFAVGMKVAVNVALKPDDPLSVVRDAEISAFVASAAATRDPPPPAAGVPEGIIITGSTDTFVTKLPAARNFDLVTCFLHAPPIPKLILTGAKTIRINLRLAARVTEKVVPCGAKISTGASSVLYGGPSAIVNFTPRTKTTLAPSIWFLAEVDQEVRRSAPKPVQKVVFHYADTGGQAQAPVPEPAKDPTQEEREKAEFERKVREDLAKIAATPSGKKLLDELAQSGFFGPDLARARAFDLGHADLSRFELDTANNPVCEHKGSTWTAGGVDKMGKRIPPAQVPSSVIRYRPGESHYKDASTPWKKDSPSDATLFHELVHARNISKGETNLPRRHGQDAAGLFETMKQENIENGRFVEEFNTVVEENQYRAERNPPLAQRTSYF